jgi:hypothetical protein
MLVVVMLFLTGGSMQAYAQEACTFVGGFAELRALVGEQTIGACLENEHFNLENGNAEQRTTGGLLVWRKVDNFTAFTDGGTTWVNGPNGLQSRPNGERLAWELDPVSPVSAPATATPRPLPTLPVTTPLASTPVTAPRVLSEAESTIGSPNYAAQAGTGSAPAAQASTGSTVPPPSAASTASSAASATPTPSTATTGVTTAASSSGASTAASTVPPPPGSSSNTVAAVAAAPTAATPTKTATPKSAVTAKFTERPDDVDTGNDAQFEVEVNAKKGNCNLTVAYRNTSEVSMGSQEIDDGKCEWKFTLPSDAKTGKAKAVVTVVANGETVKVEDTFEVKKGDTVYAGSVDLEVDALDMPDNDVQPGEEIKIGVDTNLKRKGSCSLTMAWPKVGPVNGESQMPDDSGKCSWKVTVPATVPAKSTASLTVTVYKDSSTYRTLTKEFKVAK